MIKKNQEKIHEIKSRKMTKKSIQIREKSRKKGQENREIIVDF